MASGHLRAKGRASMGDEQELKIQVALLAQSIASLTSAIDKDTRSLASRMDKLEATTKSQFADVNSWFKWGAIAIVGAVLTQVLRTAGIG